MVMTAALFVCGVGTIAAALVAMLFVFVVGLGGVRPQPQPRKEQTWTSKLAATFMSDRRRPQYNIPGERR